MKVNYAGCAICDSTWGDTWETIDGDRFFFCCPICAIQFQQVVRRVKEATGWAKIDSLEIAGDRRGRTVRVAAGDLAALFEVAFNSDGELRTFRPATG